ncbi:hypothetical protein CI238_07114 [Colletotrichum incanum]|uniref:Uncharacterized protein n=1 Tax=Colletotrichum incanum TaxID=1573173 RepID=A0A166MSA7_COLIC|nr:hypothetical protein CI238_07114 [Colletotrichum incanum]
MNSCLVPASAELPFSFLQHAGRVVSCRADTRGRNDTPSLVWAKPQGARTQESMLRCQIFMKDQAIHNLQVGVAAPQRPSSHVTAAIANVGRLGLGHSSTGAGGAVGRPVSDVPANLCGTDSQFSNSVPKLAGQRLQRSVAPVALVVAKRSPLQPRAAGYVLLFLVFGCANTWIGPIFARCEDGWGGCSNVGVGSHEYGPLVALASLFPGVQAAGTDPVEGSETRFGRADNPPRMPLASVPIRGIQGLAEENGGLRDERDTAHNGDQWGRVCNITAIMCLTTSDGRATHGFSRAGVANPTVSLNLMAIDKLRSSLRLWHEDDPPATLATDINAVTRVVHHLPRCSAFRAPRTCSTRLSGESNMASAAQLSRPEA